MWLAWLDLSRTREYDAWTGAALAIPTREIAPYLDLLYIDDPSDRLEWFRYFRALEVRFLKVSRDKLKAEQDGRSTRPRSGT